MHWLLFFIAVTAARAQSPSAAAPVALPESFTITYETEPGAAPAGYHGNKVTISYSKGAGKLEVTVPEKAKPKKSTKDPWKSPDLELIWKEIVSADLFNFKAEEGAAAPDFGSRKLAADATVDGKHREVSFEWTKPLKNDGKIWKLLDELGRITNSEASVPWAPLTPGSSPSPGN